MKVHSSDKDSRQVGDVVRQIRDFLTLVYGKLEASAMVKLIFSKVKGWSPTQIIVNEDKELSEFAFGKLWGIARNVAEGQPIQYVLGEARFYGMDFEVGSGVLVPRPETEELVEAVIQENKRPDLKVLDIGTGSGAIAVALARNLPFSNVTAIDISPIALEWAQKNASRYNAPVRFILADVFKWGAPEACFDVIVSNPPYIAEKEKSGMERNVLDHEPSLALFVSDDEPIVYYNRIADIGLSALKDGGKLYFEVNPLYCKKVCEMLEEKGYSDIMVKKDFCGRDRIVSAKLMQNN